ncbi:MAG: hypothetical protein J6A01_12545, partial [Proteobacteria bacterium]|nr:hypothetical protein [Pseudomonadota bacterium]
DVESNMWALGLPGVYIAVIMLTFSIGFYVFLPEAFWILMGMVIVPVIMIIIILKLSNLKKIFLNESAEEKQNALQKHEKYQEIKNRLFANGRKCIATIVDIEYIPHPREFVENGIKKEKYYRALNQSEIDTVMSYRQKEPNPTDTPYTITYRINKIEDLKGNPYLFCPLENIQIREYEYLKRASLAAHSMPMFRITYAFNPPDDEKKEDLVHSITTHIEPEGHYNVGDPFPILYLIRRDEKGQEHVDSMPFPIPLDDVIDLKDIVHAG